MTRAMPLYHPKAEPLHPPTAGKKLLMGVTGIIGFGFVIIHMLGNMQVYLGPEKINSSYAVVLKSSLPVLWTARLVLLSAILIHIRTAYQLAQICAANHSCKCKSKKPGYAKRTLRWSGPILGLFIIYHLLHLTAGTAHQGFHPGDVYHNIVSGFQVWYVSAVYIIAMLALSLHLYFGAKSMFHSLGVKDPRYDGLIRTVATLGTVIVVSGDISVPVAVLLGFIK